MKNTKKMLTLDDFIKKVMEYKKVIAKESVYMSDSAFTDLMYDTADQLKEHGLPIEINVLVDMQPVLDTSLGAIETAYDNYVDNFKKHNYPFNSKF